MADSVFERLSGSMTLQNPLALLSATAARSSSSRKGWRVSAINRACTRCDARTKLNESRVAVSIVSPPNAAGSRESGMKMTFRSRAVGTRKLTLNVPTMVNVSVTMGAFRNSSRVSVVM
jgi:hypothetical protein